MMAPSAGMRIVAGMRRGWSPPRLKANGQPYRPTAVTSERAIGDTVEWWEHEPVRSPSGIPTGAHREIKRTGQVWSGCPKAPGAVWVAPSDGGPAVALSKTLDVLR